MSERKKQNYEKYYEKKEMIGTGGYGCVYKGKDKKSKEMRAIKVISIEKIRLDLLSQYDKKEIAEQIKLYIEGFIQEYTIMEICSKNNENSIKCYEYFNNEDHFAIVMELCDMNLLQFLNKRYDETEKGFNSEEIYEIMNQLNKTLKIMKENSIIHRDLKLENILIKYNDKENNKYTIKLSDYGSSKRLISLSRKCNTLTGTLVSMAPEILKGEEYNYKCDLWSLGIIIYRLIFHTSPYFGKTEIALINHIDKFGNKSIKIENKDLENLVKKLLEKEPSKRIDWDDYFNHSFFKAFKPIKIKLIYYLEEEKYEEQQIFGFDFVNNNKMNINLMINGLKKNLVYTYKLKKGENIIEIIIKNKLQSLKEMFSG